MMAVNVDEKAEEAISLGTPHALFRLPYSPEAIFGSGYDVTADGQRFLITEANSPPGIVPFTLVTNWDAELKKK
jgi:hypothetical protein